MKHERNWNKNVIKINLLRVCSMAENFTCAFYEFIIILVSWPV